MAARNQLVAPLKRNGPTVVLALVLLFGAVSGWQAWSLVRHLRSVATETSRIYGQIVAALNDTTGRETETLFNLVQEVNLTGIPLVITDSTGQPTAAVNLPFEIGPNFERNPRVREYIGELDRTNPPMTVPGGSRVHFGELPVTRQLVGLWFLQLIILIAAVAIGLWAYRTQVERHRDRLWVAMARESAHQLGTPLMSAGAWVERLADSTDRGAREVAGHLTADLDRLERVAKRFERIGRPARHDKVALGVLAERVAAYFEPRLPKHANRVRLWVRAPKSGPTIQADPVLVEWAIEALVRNAIDALSGRGGSITIQVSEGRDNVTVKVTDDGPGVPPEVRSSLFEPGTSTKSGGWGIGLALTRRIVEDVHGGRLELLPTPTGAAFQATLPVAASPVNAD
jgi:signal transduction histidine kinase